MIMLDTNVVSELMRPQSSRTVTRWIDQIAVGDLFINAVVRAEIERGLRLMPRGKRQAINIELAARLFSLFEGRCLPFEESAAVVFGQLSAHRMRAGRPISVEDALIAAIALVHGMKLATRNSRDFAHIDGLELINPWNRP